MALGALPYRPRITGHSVDANGVSIIRVDVLDRNNAVRGSGQAYVFPDQDPWMQAQTVLSQVLQADAGSLAALVAAIAANSPTKAWYTGDPAYVPDSITLNGVGVATWTNQPAALTELAGTRVRIDLSLASQARFTLNLTVAGVAAAVLALQFSTNAGTTWAYLDGVSGPSVNIGTTGARESTWVDLTAAAKADVLIRIVGQGGNGTLDPAFGLTLLQVR